MDDNKKARAIVKIGTNLVTVGSLDFLIGGILAAVMPGGVGLPIMAARFIGGLALAGYLGDKMENYINTSVDQAFDIAVLSKELVTKIKTEVNNREKEMGA